MAFPQQQPQKVSKLMARRTAKPMKGESSSTNLKHSLQHKKVLLGVGHEESINTDGEKEIPRARQLQRHEYIPRGRVIQNNSRVVIDNPMAQVDLGLLHDFMQFLNDHHNRNDNYTTIIF